MNLAKLAERGGVSARTIRYYIAKGLVLGPLRAGRGAEYGPGHVERLERIQALKKEGHTLVEIRHLLEEGAAGKKGRLQPSLFLRYQVSDDVVVQVRSDVSPWRLRRIQNLAQELNRQLEDEEEQDGTGR